MNSTNDNGILSILEVPNLTGTPERNLLMAILERAILDYVGNDLVEERAASEWLFSDFGRADFGQGEVSQPMFDEFTFPWLCEQLDLDHQKIAKKIKEMPKRGSHRIAPWHFAKHSFGGQFAEAG